MDDKYERQVKVEMRNRERKRRQTSLKGRRLRIKERRGDGRDSNIHKQAYFKT